MGVIPKKPGMVHCRSLTLLKIERRFFRISTILLLMHLSERLRDLGESGEKLILQKTLYRPQNARSGRGFFLVFLVSGAFSLIFNENRE